MPAGDRKHSRRRRSRHRSRDLIVVTVVTLLTMVIVFGLLFALTSARFLRNTGD